MNSYTPAQWLMFFYLYCFVGWLWESCYVSLQKKRWVNRGFLHLPLLPLYGSGAVLVLFTTLPFRGNAFLMYLTGAVSATILELVVGLGMEALYKVRYWDYRHKSFNYKGVICLESSMFWGILTLFLVDVAQAPLERLVFLMPPSLLLALDGAISVCFVYDTYVTNRDALRLAHLLTKMEKVREEMERELAELEEQLAGAREQIQNRVAEEREEAGRRFEEAMERWEQRKSAYERRREIYQTVRRDDYEKARAALLAKTRAGYDRRMEEWMAKAEPLSRGMLRRNPTARAAGYDRTFRELKRRAKK